MNPKRWNSQSHLPSRMIVISYLTSIFYETCQDIITLGLLRNGYSICDGWTPRGMKPKRCGYEYQKSVERMLVFSKELPNYHVPCYPTSISNTVYPQTQFPLYILPDFELYHDHHHATPSKRSHLLVLLLVPIPGYQLWLPAAKCPRYQPKAPLHRIRWNDQYVRFKMHNHTLRKIFWFECMSEPISKVCCNKARVQHPPFPKRDLILGKGCVNSRNASIEYGR